MSPPRAESHFYIDNQTLTKMKKDEENTNVPHETPPKKIVVFKPPAHGRSESFPKGFSEGMRIHWGLCEADNGNFYPRRFI